MGPEAELERAVGRRKAPRAGIPTIVPGAAAERRSASQGPAPSRRAPSAAAPAARPRALAAGRSSAREAEKPPAEAEALILGWAAVLILGSGEVLIPGPVAVLTPGPGAGAAPTLEWGVVLAEGAVAAAA